MKRSIGSPVVFGANAPIAAIYANVSETTYTRRRKPLSTMLLAAAQELTLLNSLLHSPYHCLQRIT